MTTLIGRAGFILAVLAATYGCVPKPSPTSQPTDLRAPTVYRTPAQGDSQASKGQTAERTSTSSAAKHKKPQRSKTSDPVAHSKPSQSPPATQPAMPLTSGDQTSVKLDTGKPSAGESAKSSSATTRNTIDPESRPATLQTKASPPETQLDSVQRSLNARPRVGVGAIAPTSTSAARVDSHALPSINLTTRQPSTVDRPAGLSVNPGETRPNPATITRPILPLSTVTADGNTNGRGSTVHFDLPPDRRGDELQRALPESGVLMLGQSGQAQSPTTANLNVFDRLLAEKPANPELTVSPSSAVPASPDDRMNAPDSARISLPTVSAGQSLPASGNESLPLVAPNAEALRQQLTEQQKDAARRDQAARDALNRGVLDALIGPSPTTAPSSPTTRPTLALPWR